MRLTEIRNKYSSAVLAVYDNPPEDGRDVPEELWIDFQTLLTEITREIGPKEVPSEALRLSLSMARLHFGVKMKQNKRPRGKKTKKLQTQDIKDLMS